VGMGSKRVPVCDEEKTIVLMLHLQESSYSPKVIPQVEVPGGSNTTYYSFHY